jgi:hypothetical protein
MGYTSCDIYRNIGVHPSDSGIDLGRGLSGASAKTDGFPECRRVDSRERRLPQNQVEFTVRRQKRWNPGDLLLDEQGEPDSDVVGLFEVETRQPDSRPG